MRDQCPLPQILFSLLSLRFIHAYVMLVKVNRIRKSLKGQKLYLSISNFYSHSIELSKANIKQKKTNQSLDNCVCAFVNNNDFQYMRFGGFCGKI